MRTRRLSGLKIGCAWCGREPAASRFAALARISVPVVDLAAVRRWRGCVAGRTIGRNGRPPADPPVGHGLVRVEGEPAGIAQIGRQRSDDTLVGSCLAGRSGEGVFDQRIDPNLDELPRLAGCRAKRPPPRATAYDVERVALPGEVQAAQVVPVPFCELDDVARPLVDDEGLRPAPSRSDRKRIHWPSAVQVGWVWYGLASLAGSVVSASSVTPVTASVSFCFSTGSRRPTPAARALSGARSAKSARTARFLIACVAVSGFRERFVGGAQARLPRNWSR